MQPKSSQVTLALLTLFPITSCGVDLTEDQDTHVFQHTIPVVGSAQRDLETWPHGGWRSVKNVIGYMSAEKEISYFILYNSNLYNCFWFTNQCPLCDPASKTLDLQRLILDPAMVATPLPQNPFTGQPHPGQAYQKCLDLESLAPTNPELKNSSPPGRLLHDSWVIF